MFFGSYKLRFSFNPKSAKAGLKTRLAIRSANCRYSLFIESIN